MIPRRLDCRAHSAEVTLGPLQPLDDLGVGMMIGAFVRVASCFGDCCYT